MCNKLYLCTYIYILEYYEYIQNTLNEFAKNNTKQTIENIYKIINGVFTFAYNNNYISRKPYVKLKLNGIKTFKENTEIDFEQYSRFLVYISEIDELKQVNEKIERTSKNIEKRLKNIETSIVQYHNIEDTFLKTVANGFIEKDK